jgi:ABC-type multidrug transport system fused ATPase/permease subunit
VTERGHASTRLLGPFLTRHWRALAVSAVSTVVLTAAELAAPWPLKIVIDRLLQDGGSGFHVSSDWPLLAGVAALVIAIAAVGAVASYSSDVLLNRAGERIAHDLRVAVYAHLQRLSLGFHDRRPKGDLVSRVTGDVNAVGALFSDSLGQISSAVLLLVGMVVVSFILDPLLALVTFAVTPVLGYITFRYRRRIKDLSRQQRAEEGEIASLATEALSAIQVVKAFGSEGYEHERVQERSELRRQIGVDTARSQAWFSALVDVLGAVAAALVLVFGVFRVTSGALTAGSLVVFAAYAGRTYKPLRDLARQSAAVSRAGARADRIAELLATDDGLRDRPGAYAGARADGAVQFDGVSFAYTSDRPALDDVSLSLAPGQRIAIVGRSGAGKSTLAALLARFYDPDDGCIRIDGRDARDCSLAWLREQVGILLQDTVLFRGSVADNIAYGSTAGRDEIVAAARAAGADEFVAQLPQGYDTELGAAGAGLSGGQRQRLGIARVLLRDPPILVLDEPTTGLDAASESRVVAALERLMAGRTTLVVTHSIALARRAGRVLVVDRGRIVEDGTPQKLLAEGGTFSTLAAHQGLDGAGNPAPRLRDPRMPQLAALLDPDAASLILARTLRGGSDLGEVTPRAVTYKPGRRLVVTYDAIVDGTRREAVVIADAKRDLAAVASQKAKVAAAQRVNGRSPVDRPLLFDTGANVLVQWLPYDLELPLLREPPDGLARRLGALGLDADPVCEPRRLGYKPLHRVVLGVGGHIVKGYATEAKLDAAARGPRFAEQTRIRTAAFEARLDALGATVQTALPGSIATDDRRLAPLAGALVRELHEGEPNGLPRIGPDRHLRAAVESAHLVSAVLPELGARTRDLVESLERSLTDQTELVCSHGDFEVGQLLEHGDDVAVLDFDELCSAPRALDLSNYAAHAARQGGAAAALAVTDALVTGYGTEPEGLRPYLAASILIRAQAPFRKFEDGWPARVDALVAAAEEVLA